MNEKLNYPFIIAWRDDGYKECNKFYLINNIIDYHKIMIKFFNHYRKINYFNYLDYFRDLSEEDAVHDAILAYGPNDCEMIEKNAKLDLMNANIQLDLLDKIEKEELEFNKAKLILELFSSHINYYNQYFNVVQISDINESSK